MFCCIQYTRTASHTENYLAAAAMRQRCFSDVTRARCAKDRRCLHSVAQDGNPFPFKITHRSDLLSGLIDPFKLQEVFAPPLPPPEYHVRPFVRCRVDLHCVHDFVFIYFWFEPAWTRATAVDGWEMPWVGLIIEWLRGAESALREAMASPPLMVIVSVVIMALLINHHNRHPWPERVVRK